MNDIFLDWNLGLGDAIICNGLVRELAKRYENVVLPSYEQNLPSVRQMFSDLENVAVVSAATAQPISRILKIGLNNPHWGTVEPFDRAFYEFAGVSFEKRWESFHVPQSGTELTPSEVPYALIHEDVARGFRIDHGRFAGDSPAFVIRVQNTDHPITDWIPMIEQAIEVHCIDSAISHLVESVPTRGKLFYHQYARPAAERQPVNAVFRKDWMIFE